MADEEEEQVSSTHHHFCPGVCGAACHPLCLATIAADVNLPLITVASWRRKQDLQDGWRDGFGFWLISNTKRSERLHLGPLI